MSIPKVSKVIAESNSEIFEEADFLLAGISWQDALLQSYRNYLLVTQSIFVAVSVALFSAQATSDSLSQRLLFFIPFVIISIIGLLTLKYLSVAIIERAKSVDWWQKRLLKHENTFNVKRHFTTFRTAKEHSFKPPETEANSLSQEDLDSLMRPDTPKARKVFGLFVPGFFTLWIIIILSSIFSFPWKDLIATVIKN